MAKPRKAKVAKASIEDRFEFIGDAIAPGDKAALRSAMFEVEDKITGLERNLKLWRKTRTSVDDDLRQLWLHEMRQIQRVMSYAGAHEVIVDVLEFVEDDEHFGVVLERIGQPLTERRRRASRQHWLRNLGGQRPRALFWRNIKRLVSALGIIHAQGLVHGRINADVVMTEGADEPDFQLGGFEWSLRLSADSSDQPRARTGSASAAIRVENYSFVEDWRALGLLIADCLESVIRASGDVQPNGRIEPPINLSVSERVLVKRLAMPTRMDQLDADSIGRAIDDLITSLARSTSDRAGTFVLAFDQQSKLSELVYDATNGEIPIDEFRRQIEWVQADLDGGATLLVPKSFEPTTGRFKLVTDNAVYKLRAFQDEGSAVWDIAICHSVEAKEQFGLGESYEHSILQPIVIAKSFRDAKEMRGRLGPDVLDWSAFADPMRDLASTSESDTIRRALTLVQTIEAVVKALEVYPVEKLDERREQGRLLVTLRAEPNSERDRVARRLELSESSFALKRLFEEEHRDADAKWQISQAASLGAVRTNDVVASFVDVVEHEGRLSYRFEVDEPLPRDGRLFLRTERDTGTEQAISRRLRNIKGLNTRIDLGEMLADPWRVSRSSRETFTANEQQDHAFQDLDKPKQEALLGLWSTLPSFFVVGPPGVGKTKLATEVVRRRFIADHSTRLLVTAQGHDALNNLQDKIKNSLVTSGLNDVLIVRSTTSSDRRKPSSEDIHQIGLGYLDRLSESKLAYNAPTGMRARILALRDAAGRPDFARDNVDREQRSELSAVSSLLLDAANIVFSTANSPDIERLVEAREQFDWVIVEEAAKATGPELVGPLMLSGRRLLIGDHHQLPPFESERMVKILSDHALVKEALEIAEQFIGPILRDGELEELSLVAADSDSLKNSSNMALRLLEPFRTFAEDDERRRQSNPNHRPIVATLTEQRRMDPAIAEIVSNAFYRGKLATEAKRAQSASEDLSPILQLAPMSSSPVVVIDFPHVSATGKSIGSERSRPRYHNPSEVKAVINVLRHLRPRDAEQPPSLAILSPYQAQVDQLLQHVTAAKSSTLRHLDQFASVRNDGVFVGTVDSFQGSEADIVILSLVRNNPRTGRGALGFLRDKRRMNVALSRAKSQLIIVGSLAFLREAVRGVNPDAETNDLSFLTSITDTITSLARQERNGVPLVTALAPNLLEARK